LNNWKNLLFSVWNFKDIYGEYTYEISTKYKEWKYDYLLKHLSNKLDGVE